MTKLARTISFSAATAALMLASASANAASLTGDTVSKVVTNGSFNSGVESFLVGAGNDEVDGNIRFDLDAGGGGQLSITVDPGSYCGMYDCVGLTEVVFSGMDFSGGELLTGFNVLNAGPLNVTAMVLSGTSLKLSWTEGDITGGTFTLGEYVTSPSAVPVPAALPLLATGLGALGFIAHRRRKAASA